MGLGLVVAIVGGTVIGRLHLESQVEDYVYKIKMGEALITHLTFEQRLADAVSYTKDILLMSLPLGARGNRIRGCHTRLRPYRFCCPLRRAGQPVGRAHGRDYRHTALLQRPRDHPHRAGPNTKGLPMGTTSAFMMAITAISTPEMVILRKVIKPKLIAVFIGVVTLAIIMIGYVFNAVL